MGSQEEKELALFPDHPVNARRCDPLRVSADCKQVCRCDDNADYAIKEAATIETMPHSEWLCAHLAELVGLPTPKCKIVDIKGVKSFGSRWQAGEEPNWWLSVQAGKIQITDLAPSLSRIFAFDLFVNNIDRHLKNYFVFAQRSGHSILAMDFGRSWLFKGIPPPDLPMSTSTNTIRAQKNLKTLFGHTAEESEVDVITERLEKVTADEIDGIICRHPNEWLKVDQKKSILDWWVTDERTDRLEAIRKGVKDGTFL
jgi:hypothetical protein